MGENEPQLVEAVSVANESEKEYFAALFDCKGDSYRTARNLIAELSTGPEEAGWGRRVSNSRYGEYWEIESHGWVRGAWIDKGVVVAVQTQHTYTDSAGHLVIDVTEAQLNRRGLLHNGRLAGNLQPGGERKYYREGALLYVRKANGQVCHPNGKPYTNFDKLRLLASTGHTAGRNS